MTSSPSIGGDVLYTVTKSLPPHFIVISPWHISEQPASVKSCSEAGGSEWPQKQNCPVKIRTNLDSFKDIFGFFKIHEGYISKFILFIL